MSSVCGRPQCSGTWLVYAIVGGWPLQCSTVVGRPQDIDCVATAVPPCTLYSPAAAGLLCSTPCHAHLDKAKSGKNRNRDGRKYTGGSEMWQLEAGGMWFLREKQNN